MADKSDGSLIIDTRVDKTGIEKGTKDIEQACKNTSKTVEGMTSSISGYSKEAMKFVEDYAKNMDHASKTNNEFRKEITEAEAALKKLEKQGLWYGDEEFDKAVVKLESMKQAVKDYEKELISPSENANPFGTDTYMGKIREAEIELAKLARTGKSLGDTGYDEVYRKLSLLKAEAKEYAAQLSKTPAQAQKEAETLAARQRAEETRIAAVCQKMEELRAKEVQAIMEAQRLQEIGENAEVSRQDIVDLNAELERLIKRQKELQSAGVGVGYLEYDDNAIRIAEIRQSLNEYETSLRAGEEETTRFSSVLGGLKKAAISVASGIEKTGDKAVKAFKRAAASLLGFNKTAKTSKRTMGTSLKTVLKYAIGIRSLYVLFNRVRSAAAEGFKNLAQYDSGVNRSISDLLSSLTRLKNSLAAAFAPLVNAVSPILTKFVNLLATAINYVGMFFAAITGQNSYTKAIGVNEDYAASLGDTANAADTAADATNKAADASDRYLSGIDEISRFRSSSDKANASAGPSTGNAGTGGMFETVQIENSVSNLADKVKSVFSGIFDVFQEAWKNKGETVLSAAKGMLQNIQNVAKSIGKTFYEVFTSGTGLDWVDSCLERLRSMFDVVKSIANAFSDAWNSGAGLANVTALFAMLTNINNLIATIRDSFGRAFSSGVGAEIWKNILDIITGVYNTIGNIASRITIAWNTAGVGDSIWKGILNCINNIAKFIKDIVNATADWAGSLNFYPLLEAINELFGSMDPLISTIGDTLYNVYTKYILPVAKYLIEQALPWIIEKLSELFKFLSEHQGVIEGVGTALIGAFAAVKIVGSIMKIIASVKSFMGILSAGSGLISILSGAGGITVAIAAVIAAGVLLITHWDDICAAAKDLADWIKKKWKDVQEWTSQTWDKVTSGLSKAWGDIKTKASNAFNSIKSTISRTWSNVKSETSSAWSNIKSAAGSKWNEMKSSASNVFGGIKSTINDAWNSTKDNASKAWDSMKSIVTGALNTMSKSAANTGSMISSALKNGFQQAQKAIKAPINGIIWIINSLVSGITNGINLALRALNHIQIDIPSWVPVVGGKKLGFNFSMLTAPKIPYLATGAVIPPNAPFMAVLGDQKSGTNIEAPEALLRKIIREELGSRKAEGNNKYQFIAQINRRTLFEEMITEARMRQSSSGRNPFELA